MGDSLLSIENLKVSFSTENGVAEVLDGVNFSINSGEIVGLVGESGCGKTTLARSILGILPRNSAKIFGGSITFNDQNLLKMQEEDIARDIRGRLITFIPQDPFSSFNPVFTIGAQIMDLMKWKYGQQERRGFFGGVRKPEREKHFQKVVELLQTVQLPDAEGILRKYPHEVSGGQRQRLMIAMALLSEPRLIIADEPTTALDVTIQAQILKLLRQLARERDVAVLFTTHDLGAAYEICDRVTVMYAGQEVESAPVGDFFVKPRHPYTKRLLDSLPSNSGKLEGIPGQIPALISPPTGCRFHPRCSFASTDCAAIRPELHWPSDDHMIRCYHPKTYD